MAEVTSNAEEQVHQDAITTEENETVDKNKSEGTETEEIVVTIGEDPPPQEEEPAPVWVKELRKNFRTVQREKIELEKKLQELQAPKVKHEELGKKPTLEELDYDADRYEVELENWIKKSDQLETKKAAALAEQQKQQEKWQHKLNSYSESKSKLAVKDFDDAEEVVINTLSDAQRTILLEGVKNPALLVYALGKNPKKVKDLASLQSPVEFAIALGELASQLKVAPRKSAPQPEESFVRGTGSLSSTVDSTLDRLRDEAAKTGDYTKVYAYKQQKRAKAS